jgi:hypothetical protein
MKRVSPERPRQESRWPWIIPALSAVVRRTRRCRPAIGFPDRDQGTWRNQGLGKIKDLEKSDNDVDRRPGRLYDSFMTARFGRRPAMRARAS